MFMFIHDVLLSFETPSVLIFHQSWRTPLWEAPAQHSFINTDNHHPEKKLWIVLKVKSNPCPNWALGCRPRLCWASPGQLSDIAINLSRASASIKLFRIWQLLKGQRGIKRRFTRMKMSSLPHNLWSFNTHSKPYTRKQTHTLLCNVVSTLHRLVRSHTHTLCIIRLHALSLLTWLPFLARAHA